MQSIYHLPIHAHKHSETQAHMYARTLCMYTYTNRHAGTHMPMHKHNFVCVCLHVGLKSIKATFVARTGMLISQLHFAVIIYIWSNTFAELIMHHRENTREKVACGLYYLMDKFPAC